MSRLTFCSNPEVLRRREWPAVCLWLVLGILAIFLTVPALMAQSEDETGVPETAASGISITTHSYSNADGTAEITIKDAILNSNYLMENGQGDGVPALESGLQLAADAMSGSYVTAAITSPLSSTTDIVPIWYGDLPEDARVNIALRLSPDGIRWTEWMENAPFALDEDSGEHVGSLMWVGAQQTLAAQVRVRLSAGKSGDSPWVRSLTLRFSDASHGPTDEDIDAETDVSLSTSGEAPSACPPGKPKIVSRTAWGSPDGQDSPAWRPETTQVTHIVVDQTATANSPATAYGELFADEAVDWTTLMRSLWSYQANTLNWGDIGYNYVVAPDGTIYEGRAGSRQGKRNVLSRHDGYGDQAVTVALAGCYGDCEAHSLHVTQPPQAMVNRAVELIAWQTRTLDLDATGQTYFDDRLLPVIAGGRDITDSDSPGDLLYYTWLPWVRNAVRDRTFCSATVRASSSPVREALTVPLVRMQLRPDQRTMSICNSGQPTDVLADVTDLRAFSFKLLFDPDAVSLDDQDWQQSGLQLRLGPDVLITPHTVVVNNVDVEAGVADLAVILLQDATLNGEIVLATAVWLPARPGETAIDFSDATVITSAGVVASVRTEPGYLTVTSLCGLVSGRCLLQGRRTYGGTTVTNDLNIAVETDDQGYFTLPGTRYINLDFPGYLSARADLRARLSQASQTPDTAVVDLGTVTLLAGDVNGDDLVNIFDLTYLANYYQTDDPQADLNADGIVDVLDMVLLANNFGIQGPATMK